MPTLSDRLKSLGVKVGAKDLPPPKPTKTYPIEEVVVGRYLDTGKGTTFLVEEQFPDTYIHGHVGLQIDLKPQLISEWAGDISIAERSPETIAFLDTETSGLAGGTGTFAFLVGVGRYTQGGFQLAQFFMRDPFEEAALLLAIEEFLAPCQTIVSFNGKAFDVPLLNTRYTLHGWKSPFTKLAHIDLLHLSRRLWRDRLPSRTLANLEVQILHTSRTDDEIPGWMIPQLYFDYLREADARPLKRVFYHNAMDVVSLAALLNHTSSLLEDPLDQAGAEKSDVLAVGRLMEDLNHTEKARGLYEACLRSELPDDVLNATIYHLSFIYKRENNYPAAIQLWEQAITRNQIYAYEELAKYYEHRIQDIEMANHYTSNALDYLNSSLVADVDSLQWKKEFLHRSQRLYRKISTQEN